VIIYILIYCTNIEPEVVGTTGISSGAEPSTKPEKTFSGSFELSNKSNLSAFNQRNVGFMKSKFRQ
jgi:hypothetical protein